MEDAVEQLARLKSSVTACTVCEELVACRERAVPGGGHPHCAVMVVSLQPDVTDEHGERGAGTALAEALADFMPALATSAGKVYVTTLVKCVGRTGCSLRAPHDSELDACFHFLSTELTITTPHYLLAVGEATARYLLGKFFKDQPPYAPGDSLELRVFDNPAFRIVPVATPQELAARDAKARKAYSDKLRALSQVMGL
jgi:uracil-DNA glycosylase family 4